MIVIGKTWAASITGVVLGVALLTAPGLAATAEWDEDEVARLANALGGEFAAIKKGIAERREEADPESARWIVLDDLMQLQHRAVAFEGLVRAGQGRDKTAPVFRRIVTGVENARRDAEAFPEVQKHRHHIERAESLLQELSRYYE